MVLNPNADGCGELEDKEYQFIKQNSKQQLTWQQNLCEYRETRRAESGRLWEAQSTDNVKTQRRRT